MPGDRRAPIVTCDYRFIGAERIQQANNVARQMKQGVLFNGVGPVGLAVAAHIGCDGVKASFRERLQLMAPGIPRFGEPMTQDDERTGATLGDMHANAVCFNETMFEFNHRA
jgi:hypothetical protein